jgi:hypothetical protein
MRKYVSINTKFFNRMSISFIFDLVETFRPELMKQLNEKVRLVKEQIDSRKNTYTFNLSNEYSTKTNS